MKRKLTNVQCFYNLKFNLLKSLNANQKLIGFW